MHPLCHYAQVKTPIQGDCNKPELAPRLALPDAVTPAKAGAQLSTHELLKAEAGC